jgi:tetratricopeptide (TPR) repeat protein
MYMHRARHFLSAVVLLFVSVLCLSSQEFEVLFLDGLLEAREGESWIEVQTGDLLDRESNLRLEEQGIVELSDGLISITIGTGGTFSLADLVQKVSRRSSSSNLGRFLDHALAEAAGKPKIHTASGVLGARGNEAEAPEIGWIDESAEKLREGEGLLLKGSYEQALRFFEEAEAGALDEEAQHFAFYVGYTLALLGKTGPALKKLTQIKPDVTAPYYEDWVLVQGQLYYESLEYQRALEISQDYLRAMPAGDHRQAVSFIAALCLRELGDSELSHEYMERAYRIDAETEIGRAAKAQL